MITRHSNRLSWFATLMIILAAAAALRFSNADWDSGYQLHPDERAILFVAQDIHAPHSLAEALNVQASPLNPYRPANGSPRSFPYGHFPLYLTVTIQKSLSAICAASIDCRAIPPGTFIGRLVNSAHGPMFDQLTYVGRALSALFDTLAVLAAALLALELFGRQSTGLLASAFMAVSVLNIQNAHFGTVDSDLGFFCTTALWLILRDARQSSAQSAILAGAAIGLAVGCKLTGLLLVFPLVIAHTRLRRPITSWGNLHVPRLVSQGGFWLAILAAMAAFAVTNPYAVLDPGAFAAGLASQGAMVSGAAQPVYTLQFAETLPIVYSTWQLFLWGFGPLLALAAFAGLIWGWKTWSSAHSRDLLIVLVWVAVAGAVAACGSAKFPRYLIPITPALVVFGAGILTLPGWRLGIRISLTVVVFLTTAANAAAFTGMYALPHPWVSASEWLYAHVPAGSALVVESNDDALPLDLSSSDGGQIRDLTYHTAQVDTLAEPDDCAKLTRNAQLLSTADYLIIASSRSFSPAMRLRQRFPFTSAYYRKLFAGDLGFSLEHSWSRYPHLLGLTIADNPVWGSDQLPISNQDIASARLSLGPLDESFTVYDHPLALLFRNAARLPAALIAARIVGSSTCR